jgi:tripartite-type tricarboxylate transporter receptor subunit TctC
MFGKSMIASTLLSGVLAVSAGAAWAQDFPSRTVRIVTSGAGGPSDIAARLVAQGVAAPLGQSVIVENRAAGNPVIEAVLKAPPDGHTVLLYGSALWLGPFMQQNAPYDPVRDFLPVTLALSSPNILVVHPSVPARSVKELIALAKARPGELNFGTSGPGGSSHLAGELFKSMAGINIVRVNYKSGAAALIALMGGETQLLFPAASTVSSQIKSGRLRALATSGAQPSALFPSLPTLAGAGVPGYEWVGLFAVFAPAKTPAAAINRLNQVMVQMVNSPAAKEKFLDLGVEPVGSSPDQLAATVKAEMTRMGKVIKDAGIRAE